MADYAFFTIGVVVLVIAATLVGIAVVISLVAKRSYAGLLGFVLSLGSIVTFGLTILPALIFSIIGIRRKSFVKLAWTGIALSILIPVICMVLTLTDDPGGFTASRPPDAEIQRDNVLREKIGLRTVKPEWHFHGEQFGERDWKLPNSDRQAKRVHRKDDTIVWEEDYYYTDKTFRTHDGTAWEFLTLHYDYRGDRISIHCVTTNAMLKALAEPYTFGTTNIHEAIRTAEDILSQWGLSRL